jgi:cytidine deaminase
MLSSGATDLRHSRDMRPNKPLRVTLTRILGVLTLSAALSGCASHAQTSSNLWRLSSDSESIVSDPHLRAQIFRALDAAEHSGTDPRISHFDVRAATVIEKDGHETIVLGGNTEYSVPEAIHGETSVLNHVTALFGPDATRHLVRFIAYYSNHCGGGGSCGDCRDYQIAATDYEHLLVACGQAGDHVVHVTRFMDQVVCEKDFSTVEKNKIPLSDRQLTDLIKSAETAEMGGVTLFNSDRHTGAAALSFSGKTYRAAGADDAAFHYRFPIGGALQQAATECDYFIRAIVVVGAKGQWPLINYRDRQYGYEASSFNRSAGKPPIALVLSDGEGHFRMTTFESALPHAFSTADFMPDALQKFLKSHEACVPASN